MNIWWCSNFVGYAPVTRFVSPVDMGNVQNKAALIVLHTYGTVTMNLIVDESGDHERPMGQLDGRPQ